MQFYRRLLAGTIFWPDTVTCWSLIIVMLPVIRLQEVTTPSQEIVQQVTCKTTHMYMFVHRLN